MASRSRGATLLEVLVALVVLATAGTGIVTAAHDSFGVVRHSRESGRELREASAFIDAVTLWTRTELDQRLGWRRQGRWWLRIDRPVPSLYVIVLVDADRRELIRTSLYRHAENDTP